jgi:adenylate cyclase
MSPVGNSTLDKKTAERVAVRIGRRVVSANAAGAVLAALSGALTGQNIKGQPGFGTGDTVTLVVYLIVAVIVGGYFGTRWLKAALLCAPESRKPSERERKLILSLPLRFAALSMTGWVGAAVIWAVRVTASHPPGYVIRVCLSILLGGLTTSALAYLLVEGSLRSVIAVALEEGLPDRLVSPGVGTKLVASWAVGADVFLLMIGLTFLGRPPSEPPSPGAVWFIVAAGLLAGTLVVYVATRSLVIPLRRLRAAIAQVEDGALDVTVAVDDASELGLLQAGFNHMVAGLRERNALQDLFGRHVGPEVARRALEMGVTLGGERRQAAVLFVDLLHSTELSLRYSPDRVVDLLNRFFSTVVRIVEAEHGWVNKFEGDGALCVFGAPIPLDDYADRALRAARTIRAELLAIAAMHPELDAAIGVSAGAVVAGNVGAEQRYEYTVIGTPVNAAARLSEEAKHRLSRVLAGREAISCASKEARAWTVADEIALKGMGEAVIVYEPASSAASTPPAPGKDLETGFLESGA